MSGKMNGRNSRTINDYISAVVQETAAGQGQLREIEERRRVEQMVQNLSMMLRSKGGVPVVSECDYDGKRAHVIGYIDPRGLTVDENCRLGVEFRPECVVVADGSTQFARKPVFVPLGAKSISVSDNSSHPKYFHVREGVRSTASFYMDEVVVSKVLEAEFGYKGGVPKTLTPAFAQKLNGRQD